MVPCVDGTEAEAQSPSRLNRFATGMELKFYDGVKKFGKVTGFPLAMGGRR